MNEIKIFNSEEFGDIRTVQLNNETYFVGKDVATALGYADTFGALKKHIMDEDKLVCQIDSAGQKRDVTVINESGLYALIFGSKLESAKRFKHWSVKEVKRLQEEWKAEKVKKFPEMIPMEPIPESASVEEKGGVCNITTKYTESNKETKIIVNADWVKKHVLFKARTEYQPKSDYGKMMGFLMSYSVRGKNPHDDVPDGLASFALFVQNLIGATVTTYSRAALGI